MISPELTKEFQDVVREEYGRELSLEEASSILSDLTTYFDTLSKVRHRMLIQEENDIITLPD